MVDRASLTNIGRWPTPVLAVSAAFGALVFLVLLALEASALIALMLGFAALAGAGWFLLDEAQASYPAAAPKRPDPVARATTPQAKPAIAEPAPAPTAPAEPRQEAKVDGDKAPSKLAEPRAEAQAGREISDEALTTPAEPRKEAKAAGDVADEAEDGSDAGPAFKSAAVTSAAQAARAAFADLAGPSAARAPAETEKPAALPGPRDGVADDLTRIRGIGPKIADLLHGIGCYHIDQIAGWSPAEVAWIDANLEGGHGRATREDWVGQAKTLAAVGETGVSIPAGDGATD